MTTPLTLPILKLTDLMKTSVIWICFLALAGCGLIPDYQSPRPAIHIPDRWHIHSEFDTVLKPQPWLDLFADARLRSLIEEALAYNYDLKAAASRVSMARAMSRINGADRFPQLSTGIKASRAQRNSTSGFSISNPRNNSFGVDLSLNWELDIWGRLQNRSEAAYLDFSASESDFYSARLSLAAHVATLWFQSIETNLQLRLTEQKLAAFQLTEEIIQDGFIRGISGALDLRLARANVAGAQAQQTARTVELDQTLRNLEILLGRYPDASLLTTQSLPPISHPVPTGLPVQLLYRRPDLKAAEQRLLAADQRLSEAWKNLLPRFSFATSGGTNAGQLKDILNYNTLIWNIIGNVTQPIFQGGRLIAEKDLADARTQEAVANYTQTLLQAYYEVESALTSEEQLQTQEIALKKAAEESIAAERLALEEYASGLTDIITLLEAQRRSYDAQSRLLETSRLRLQNRIQLYLAIGGNLKAQEQTISTEESFIFKLFKTGK